MTVIYNKLIRYPAMEAAQWWKEVLCDHDYSGSSVWAPACKKCGKGDIFAGEEQ